MGFSLPRMKVSFLRPPHAEEDIPDKASICQHFFSNFSYDVALVIEIILVLV